MSDVKPGSSTAAESADRTRYEAPQPAAESADRTRYEAPQPAAESADRTRYEAPQPAAESADRTRYEALQPAADKLPGHASSTAAMRGEGTRGGVSLGLEEATDVDNLLPIPASSTVAVRGEGARGGVARRHTEELPARRSSTAAPGAERTCGAVTQGDEEHPARHLRSSTLALNATSGTDEKLRSPPVQGDSSSSADSGGFTRDQLDRLLAIVSKLKRDDPSSIRAVCRVALELHYDGESKMATAVADYVVDKDRCPNSVVALNLSAALHQSLGADAMVLLRRGQEEAMELKRRGQEKALKLVQRGLEEASAEAARHYKAAREHYQAAAKLAPRCIATALACGKVLAACQWFASAEQEFGRARAIQIETADDPIKHNIGYELQHQGNSTRKARVESVHAETVREIAMFRRMICGQYVPRECTEFLMQFNSGHCTIEEVLVTAKFLAEFHPYCRRVHIFVVLAEVQSIDGAAENSRMEKLQQILDTMNRSTREFRDSILIALLRAQLLFMTDKLTDASNEIYRALDISVPSDPANEDVPVGSIEGVDSDARINAVKTELQDLIGYIYAALQPKEAPSPSPDTSRPRRQRSQKNYAFMYTRIRRKHQEPPLKFIGIEMPKTVTEPVTYPVHFVRGKLVPVEEWNLYRDFCAKSSICRDDQMACHLCCFEGPTTHVILKSDAILHYHDRHSWTDFISCKVTGCHVRVRKSVDLDRHYYFAHRLPPKWWDTT